MKTLLTIALCLFTGYVYAFPSNFEILTPAIVEDFETVGDWTVAGTGASVTQETALVKSGTKAVRITMASAGGSAVITKDVSALDLSQPGQIGIRIYSQTGFQQLTILVSNDAGFANHWQLVMANTAYPYREGWNYFTIPKEVFAVGAGAPTWTNVNRVRFIGEWLVGNTGYIVLDSFVNQAHARAKAIIHFDHAYSSFWSEGGYQYLVDRGLRCDFPLLVSTPLGSLGIASEAQVRTAYDLGFGVTLHSNSHAVHTTLTQAQVRNEIALSRAYLSSLNFSRGLALYTFPQGETGFTTDAVNIDTILASESVSIGRGGRPPSTNYQQTHVLGMDNPYQFVSKDIGNSAVSLATAKIYVDDAIRLGSAIVFVFHGLNATTADADEWLTADFKAWIDYLVVQSPHIDVVTLEEYMRTLNGARFTRY